jgi:EAL domain-containing protein (putative c-di-GMP-specific phosphodiesterase class I)
VQDVQLAQSVIRRFKSQGIHVALDDFGTGYSSLRHLRELEFDRLKIDRSFVHDLDTNQTSQTIVRTITSMAHSLGIQVTVEGVDSPLNAEKVIGYGCDIAQGYLYGEPLRGEVQPEVSGKGEAAAASIRVA